MKNAVSGAVGAVAGLAIAGVMCYQGLLPKPEEPVPRADPTPIPTPCPVESHTVTFTPGATDNSTIVADEEIVGTVYMGDIVMFVNETETEITIDFSPYELGTPFYGKPKFKIAPLGDGTNVEAKVVAVHSLVVPAGDTEYEYNTTPPTTEQSPKVRVGPRRPCVQQEDED